MNYFWLDANAIVKQYVKEKRGTPLINYLFTRVSLNQILCLFDSMGEVYSAIARKANNVEITIAAHNQAIQRFETQFIRGGKVKKVNATENQKFAAWQFIGAHPSAHNINTTDAHILRCALDKADELRTARDDLILVSSDRRLLKAADKEGLLIFDPENGTKIDLDVLINSP